MPIMAAEEEGKKIRFAKGQPSRPYRKLGRYAAEGMRRLAEIARNSFAKEDRKLLDEVGKECKAR